MQRICFAIAGAGWRARAYLRIAKAAPEIFEVAGLLHHDKARAQALEKELGVRVFATAGDLLAAGPCFVATCLPWAANPGVVVELARAGMPVLSETPPAPDLEGLTRLYGLVKQLHGRVQVAEQYFLRPGHAAQLAVAARGLLGEVRQAQVCSAHGYHGISLIRKFLGIKYEDAEITAREIRFPSLQSPGRDGKSEDKLVDSGQQTFIFDFGGRRGILDFTGDHYFSLIRREIVLLRGTRGEMLNDQISALKDHRTPLALSLVRHQSDILERMYLKGIQAGQDWVYENPFAGACFSDEEIAMAGCLAKMRAFVETGEEFYPLEEACQDHYLNLMSLKALEQKATLSTARQAWAQ